MSVILYVIGNATYKSALYDTKQNANVQPTYPNLLQYTPYQVSKFIILMILIPTYYISTSYFNQSELF